MGTLHHDWLDSEKNYRSLVITATATLTHEQCINRDLIVAGHASTQVVLTLPPPLEDLSGQIISIANDEAQILRVFVLEGFGAAGVNYDTVQIPVGEYTKFMCDGTHWFSLASTAPQAT